MPANTIAGISIFGIYVLAGSPLKMGKDGHRSASTHSRHLGLRALQICRP
jgi:hypothetical protein